jgi:hypothetical protein
MDNSKHPANDVARRGFIKAIGILGGSSLLSPLLQAATKTATAGPGQFTLLQQSTGAGYPKIPAVGEWLQPLGLNKISVGGEIGRRIAES